MDFKQMAINNTFRAGRAFQAGLNLGDRYKHIEALARGHAQGLRAAELEAESQGAVIHWADLHRIMRHAVNDVITNHPEDSDIDECIYTHTHFLVAELTKNKQISVNMEPWDG